LHFDQESRLGNAAILAWIKEFSGLRPDSFRLGGSQRAAALRPAALGQGPEATPRTGVLAVGVLSSRGSGYMASVSGAAEIEF